MREDRGASTERHTSIPEELAHRVLARAIELDADRGERLSLEALRDVARQAGISPDALNDALRELHDVDRSPVKHVPTETSRWARLRDAAGRNALALAASAALLRTLDAIVDGVAAPWQAEKATMVVSLVLGAAVSSRLRARPVALLCVGLAVALAAEVTMDLVYGRPAVQGAGAHFALILGAYVGVAVGALLLGRRHGPGDVHTAELRSVDDAAAPSARARHDHLHPLLLRPGH